VNRSFKTVHAPAFGDVHGRVEREPVTLRDAAYLITVERVARRGHERGWV
jgi:glutamate dehydrogenase/leucine dehydrogenase